MLILVVGGGGREHALVWRLRQADHEVICAPGNPGIAKLAECFPISVDDHDGIARLARARHVELVVVGPEAPLVAGLADRLRIDGLAVFGPGTDGARLEGSKVWSKEFFARHGIRTADFETATTVAEADAAIERLAALGPCVVVKCDGLAAGKGVVVSESVDEAKAAARSMLEAKKFGAAGNKIVIEQKIAGREVSILAITDGRRFEMLPTAEDHKAIFDGDKGPNTGGMGTVSPSWSEAIVQRVHDEIFVPTVRGLREDGIDYRGVLYAGVMVDAEGMPWLLEYNCRFGDPETQPIMMRMTSDLGGLLHRAAQGELGGDGLQFDPRVAVCVVVAAAGYPGTPATGDVITLPPDEDDVVVFHAGTAIHDGRLVSAGGRVLGVTALGETVEAARAKAYGVVDRIGLAGMQVRRDIGLR